MHFWCRCWQLNHRIETGALTEATTLLLRGDLLFFYHWTSWRSRWIRRITGCEMPHVCIYLGEGQVVGMLKGRVQIHPIQRFFREGYKLRFIRGTPATACEAQEFVGQREAWVDLFAIGLMALLERGTRIISWRRVIPYRMRGVTCSGLVSTAWHRATGLESSIIPMKHTPLNLETIVGKESFFEAEFSSLDPWTSEGRIKCSVDEA